MAGSPAAEVAFVPRIDFSQAIPERDPSYDLSDYRLGHTDTSPGGRAPEPAPVLTQAEWDCWRMMLSVRPALRCLAVVAPPTATTARW